MTSVGASMGFALYMPPESSGGGILMMEVPGSAGQVFPGFMPGFRLTFTDDSGRNGAIFEPSVNLVSSSGATAVQLQAMASYQLAFSPRNPRSGFVNVGAGLVYQSFEEADASNPIFGGGLGVRMRSRHGHGQGRVEFRYDYIPKDERTSYQDLGLEGGSVFSFKVGFDLDTR